MQTRTVTLGKLLQRLDALFILIWDLNIISYLSIVTGFVISIFKKISNTQETSTISYTFVAILLGLSIFYQNILQARRLNSELYKYLSLILVFGIPFLILLFANIKRNKNNKKIDKGDLRID